MNTEQPGTLIPAPAGLLLVELMLLEREADKPRVRAAPVSVIEYGSADFTERRYYTEVPHMYGPIRIGGFHASDAEGRLIYTAYVLVSQHAVSECPFGMLFPSVEAAVASLSGTAFFHTVSRDRQLMKHALILLALAAGAETCAVTDTLRCSQFGRVRLRDVYAAESHEPGGTLATQRLRDLVQGRDVRIAPRGYDRYGRVLGDVYVNGHRIEQRDIGPRAGRGVKR